MPPLTFLSPFRETISLPKMFHPLGRLRFSFPDYTLLAPSDDELKKLGFMHIILAFLFHILRHVTVGLKIPDSCTLFICILAFDDCRPYPHVGIFTLLSFTSIYTVLIVFIA